MSVSRGKFLRSLGKSLPGMVLGGGIASAAQTLLGRIAVVSPPEIRSPLAAPAVSPAEPPPLEFVTRGPSEGNRIALTFDDGPTPGVTDLILDELKKRRVRATFFMVGSRVGLAPELARRVHAEGHEIGNHTFTHAKLTAVSGPEFEREVGQTQEIIQDRVQVRPVWLRPPFGALRQSQAAPLQAHGLRAVLWDVDSADWSEPGETHIVEQVLRETRAGSIILCHDLHLQTAHALPHLLDGLQSRGWVLATLSELIRAPSA